jgi:hypothetical protein
MPAPDPYVVQLAEAHVEILTAIDVFVAGKHWNQVFNIETMRLSNWLKRPSNRVSKTASNAVFLLS